MKKKGLGVLIIGMALMLTACGKTDATTEAVTEASTEEVIIEQVSSAEATTASISEEKTESNIISEGSGNDNTEEQTTEDPADALEGIAFNRKRKLPNIVEPLDDAQGFNPRIINADMFEVGEYWRKELGQEIYMILEYRNINEDPKEIEMLDRREESYATKFDAIIRFERHEDLPVEICYFDQSYVVNVRDDEDYTSYDNMPEGSYNENGNDAYSDDSLYDQGLDD